jgi:uncharacterized Zn finger protein
MWLRRITTMAAVRQLNEQQIRDWVGDASYRKGQPYARDGGILHPRRQGSTLLAQCQGSLPTPYRITAKLGARGVSSAECSCPVGEDGHCKHVAALLIAWMDDPSRFAEHEPLERLLERLSKDELIVIVRRMVRRDPNLEDLVELPVPGGPSARLLDAQVIRRQVIAAFDVDPYEWGVAFSIREVLLPLVELGDDYLQRDEYHNAALIYQTIAQGILDHDEIVLSDENGEIFSVANTCAERLAECLEATRDPAQRGSMVQALFAIYSAGIDAGGVGLGAEVPDLLRIRTTSEEKKLLARLVRDSLPPHVTGPGLGNHDWTRQAYGRFLLDLEADTLDDSTYLRICREMGLLDRSVARLLKRDRLREALALAQEASDYDLLAVGEHFVAHDYGREIEDIVRSRVGKSQDGRLTEWLLRRAHERHDLDEALALAEMLFWREPSVAGYREMKELAQSLKRWESLWNNLRRRLKERGLAALLTDLYLREGKVDDALAALDEVKSPGWGWYEEGDSLPMRVARAAETSHPNEALRLYKREAARLIELRGREHYARAANYLRRARDLYHRLNRDDEWQALIVALCNEHRRLRALLDELRQAGLG